ncbi:11940_t:CDS:2, partial [Acaulospora colombiana]
MQLRYRQLFRYGDGAWPEPMSPDLARLASHHDLRAVGNTPGPRSLISSVRPIVAVLPYGKLPFSNWFFSTGPNFWITEKHNIFARAGQDVASGLSLDYFGVVILVADADVAQEVLGNRYRFYKPIDLYGVLDLFGRNVLTTEFDDWRTHRRIASPAFSEELFNLWNGQSSVTFENVTDLFVQSFKETMEIVSSDLFMKIAVPESLMSMTKRTARVQLAFEELMRFMQEMMNERAKNYHDHSDLFSNLMAANAKNNEGLSLTDQEVIAGHETTAHSLAFSMGLLAMYPEVQEKLYNHV